VARGREEVRGGAGRAGGSRGGESEWQLGLDDVSRRGQGKAVVAHVGETVGGSRSGTMGATGGAATMRCTRSGTVPGECTRLRTVLWLLAGWPRADLKLGWAGPSTVQLGQTQNKYSKEFPIIKLMQVGKIRKGYF
jgi:hypothetical protein